MSRDELFEERLHAAWSYIHEVERMLVSTAVHKRISPNQKATIVERLKRAGALVHDLP